MQKRPPPLPSLPPWERPDSLVNGLPARLAGSENLGQAPRLERGLPTRRRMLSGGPKCLIVRGSPGRGLQIPIFWVSAVSVVRRAFLEPSRRISCKSGLPPLPLWERPDSLVNGLPARLAGSENLGQAPPLGKGFPHASSNAVGWPEMAHRVVLRAFLEPGRSVS